MNTLNMVRWSVFVKVEGYWVCVATIQGDREAAELADSLRAMGKTTRIVPE